MAATTGKYLAIVLTFYCGSGAVDPVLTRARCDSSRAQRIQFAKAVPRLRIVTQDYAAAL